MAEKDKNGGLAKKLILLAAVVAAIVAFKMFGFEQYLSLEYLQGSRQRFSDYYAQNTLAVVAFYMLVYIAVTALSLPGAAVMTLAGGAVFGLAVGIVVVSFASSIGATLAFLVSRYLFKDAVQSRFGARLEAINRGMEAEGAFYLFTLRLVPVFPFFIINLVMGLTRMKAWTFYWVSQVGMIAGTLVYVNAGKEIGKLTGLKGILSPGLIASFVVLGLFPVMVKKLMGAYRKQKGMVLKGAGGQDDGE